VGVTADTACSVCLPVLGGAGVCVTTTFGVAPYLSAQSSLDAGLNFAAFTGTTVMTQVNASSSGDVGSGNEIVMVSASAIANLSAGASVNDNVIFQVNSSLMVNAWNNNAGTAKVNNDGAAIVVGRLSVSGNAFSVWQSGSATVTLNSINFGAAAGTLQISGGAAHIGVSGSSASSSGSVNITGSGKLRLSGGVSVDGIIPSSVTIDVAASGSSAPLVTIDSATVLNISGDVTTSSSASATASSNGVISVNGDFILGSTTANVDPQVVLNSGARLVVNSATKLQAKALAVYAGSTLVIGASANRAQVYFDKIASCVGTVQIRLDTTASAFISSNGATAAVGFKYSSTNDVQQLKQCAVEVVDSANQKFTLTSTTSASAGRRLLASQGTATWGSDSMTFQMAGNSTQSSSAPIAFAAVPLLMVVSAGLFF